MAFADRFTLTMLTVGTAILVMGVPGFNAAFRGTFRDRLTRVAASAPAVAVGALLVWLGYTRGIGLG